MDFRQLRYFVEVANTTGFNEAATRLHVSQSSVSRRIQDLERNLGVTLFERGVDGAKLTEAGRQLFNRANIILREIEIAQAEVRGRAAPHGSVTVGTSLTMSRMLLPELTRRIAHHFPAVNLVFAEGTQYSLMEGLDTGRIDLAVMLNPRFIRSCGIYPLCDEPLFWVYRPKSGRRPRRATLRHLHGQPLVLFPKPSAHRDMLEKVAAGEGVVLDVRWEIANVETQKDFIRLGLAQGILPFSAVAGEVSRHLLRTTPISSISLRQCLVFRNNREGSSAAMAVANAVRTIFREMVDRRAFSGYIGMPSSDGWIEY